MRGSIRRRRGRGRGRAEAGESVRKPVRLTSFTLGAAEFGHEPAFMVHNLRDAGHDFDGLMSPAAPGITRIAVDLGQGKLAFTR
jgi:hypothetical protein